jgi:lipoyl(octanoyl) transferase
MTNTAVLGATGPATMLPQGAGRPVAWTVADRLVPYPEAVAAMETRVAAILAGEKPEQLWLLEHPPLYTAGTSSEPADLLSPDRFPVFRTGRGGEYTYHGPGQRVAYVMLDLGRRQRDVRRFVSTLEEWIIATLAVFNVRAGRRKNCVGIWIDGPDKGVGKQDKIAAIGVRIRRWVTFHGVALNVDPMLEHFSGIVPCGVSSQGVTSLADQGVIVTMAEVDAAMRREFETLFGKTA